jgi:hypothetical protein
LAFIDITLFHYLSEDFVFIVKEVFGINAKVSSPKVGLWDTLALIGVIGWISIGRAILNKMATPPTSSANIAWR